MFTAPRSLLVGCGSWLPTLVAWLLVVSYVGCLMGALLDCVLFLKGIKHASHRHREGSVFVCLVVFCAEAPCTETQKDRGGMFLQGAWLVCSIISEETWLVDIYPP